MSAIAGRVLLIPKGNYDSTATYTMLDMVVYNGSSYICKQECTGVVPTNTTYWMLNASGSAVAYINDIGDVVITNPTNGQVLMYNSTTHKWVNGTLTLNGLNDTQFASLSDGQVLKYNATTQKWENADETGGILPHLIVISETGSTVTATKGQTVITATETSTGHFECDLTEFGTWTIDAILGGDDAQVSLVVDAVKIYTVDDSHFHADITVKYPGGATCNLAGQGESYYATGSPYTFTVHHAGQYTITVVYDGQTYTETVTVTTTGQTFTKKVPTPSSAPANDIDWWLWFGGVSGSYSSLSDILADSTALATLMASTDAVDYLVRCKEWITSKALVPTMTSNTAPSGEVIYSAQDNSFPAWKVFDGNNTQSSANSSFWMTGNSFASGDYIGYKFPQATIVRKFDIRNGWWDTYPINITYKIQGSNDNSTWTDLFESVEENFAINTGIHSHSFENNTAYLYYRVRFSSFSAGSPPISYMSIATLQFYPSKESEGVTDNQSAMSYIGLNNYCANTLLADSDWLEGIGNSTYMESVLNVKVPTMTSATAPSGEVLSYGGVHGSSRTWYAFDNNNSTECISAYDIGNGLGYNFGKNVSVKMAYVLPDHADTFKIQVSSDGSTWVDIATLVGDATNGSYGMGANNNNSFPYARVIQSTKISTDSWQRYTTIQFYGREDV